MSQSTPRVETSQSSHLTDTSGLALTCVLQLQPAFQAPPVPHSFAPQAPYTSFTTTYKSPVGRAESGSIPSGMSRTALGGTSYNANSLAHFAPTANTAVWPPPPNAAKQLRSQITEVLRRNSHIEDGVSVRTIDAVVRGFSVIDISNEINRMSDEGKQGRSVLTCTTQHCRPPPAHLGALFHSLLLTLPSPVRAAVHRFDLLSEG